MKVINKDELKEGDISLTVHYGAVGTLYSLSYFRTIKDPSFGDINSNVVEDNLINKRIFGKTIKAKYNSNNKRCHKSTGIHSSGKRFLLTEEEVMEHIIKEKI